MAHVFTYGSLMFREVWQRVVRGHYASLPATLAGYARHALRDRGYPGIVAGSGTDSVAGVLYRDVCADDLARLDAFEGDEYRRINVNLRADGMDGLLAGETYLYTGPHLLPRQAWLPGRFDLTRFLRDHLPAEG